jgi:hypothetical protein
MNWREVARNWPAFVEVVAARWSRADATRLLAIDGNREQFEAYISRTHDLTQAEVREDVDVLLAGPLLADGVRGETTASSRGPGASHLRAEEDAAPDRGEFGADRARARPARRTRDG